MDLTTIKKQIEMGMIRTTERFQRDMMLMFTNALMYNNSDQDIYHMAMEMYKDVMVHIEVHILVHISRLLLRLFCMCSISVDYKLIYQLFQHSVIGYRLYVR